MSFKVVHREKQMCKCDLPSTGFNTKDVIQCESCNTYWRCTGLSDGGMQWDPYPRTLLWERVHKLRNERENRVVWETF
jgi:hypothetical protein